MKALLVGIAGASRATVTHALGGRCHTKSLAEARQVTIDGSPDPARQGHAGT
jgi:hypothetical protein